MSALDYFNNRHTVRKYQDSDIPLAQIKAMLEAAAHAPNTGNMQWYSVIITRDKEQKQRLAPAHFNQQSVCCASAVLTFCIDIRRFEHWCRLNNAVPGFNNFQSFVAAIIDTSLFAQQFCTIAEMDGFGTCYLGTTTYNAPQIAEILELPERVVPVTTITLGVPTSEETAGPTTRLPVQSLIHEETYKDATDDEIKEWYNQIETESQHFVDENNKETLAQVFTDIRYPRESAEYFSKVYSEFLNKNKF